VRLKPEKVEDLSRQIAAELRGDKRVEVLVPDDRLELEIRKVFLADLKREDDLMEEVERIIQANRDKIVGKNIDLQLFRRKVRDQLVRQRKIIL